MKKILLSLCVLTVNTFFAQMLETENYEALTVGNLSTNTTGASPGQGGNYLLASGGAVTDAQIVNEGGTQGKVLQVIGSTANLVRYVYKMGLGTSWSARTSGNNIVDVEYDFFTGPATTSKNIFNIAVYDSTYGKILVGLSFAADTKIISGVGYFTSAGTTANYSFNLGSTANPTIVLPANTWVRVGCSFNKTNGEIIWKGPGFFAGGSGAGTGTDIAEIDFLVAGGGASNAASATAKFDNYTAVAKSVSALLSNNEIITQKFSIYPNPANDLVTISKNSAIDITSVIVTDINGRIVKEINNDATTINVSDLNAGVYFLKINTAEGSGTTKLIKN